MTTHTAFVYASLGGHGNKNPVIIALVFIVIAAIVISALVRAFRRRR